MTNFSHLRLLFLLYTVIIRNKDVVRLWWIGDLAQLAKKWKKQGNLLKEKKNNTRFLNSTLKTSCAALIILFPPLTSPSEAFI